MVLARTLQRVHPLSPAAHYVPASLVVQALTLHASPSDWRLESHHQAPAKGYSIGDGLLFLL